MRKASRASHELIVLLHTLDVALLEGTGNERMLDIILWWRVESGEIILVIRFNSSIELSRSLFIKKKKKRKTSKYLITREI